MGDAGEKILKVGSRRSQLALIQTDQVIDPLKTLYPDFNFEIVKMNTLGDKILDVPLPKIGEKSLFTKELEEALENKSVDFVVHSLKDLPTTLPPRKIIGAVLQRHDARDCVIFQEKHKKMTLKTLPLGSVIGTSSLRRTAQLSLKYPHLKISNIRGNLNTRLQKLNKNDTYDGIVLAVAGVMRMGWEDKIDEILDEDDILYAVGQGALAVECQEDNFKVLSLLTPLIHRESLLIIVAERSFLRKLEGGCSAPVAVNCFIKDDTLTLTGLVSSLDGKESLKETMEIKLNAENSIDNFSANDNDSGEPLQKRNRQFTSYCGVSPGEPAVVHKFDLETAEKLGTDLAEIMIKNGALNIMEAARKQGNIAINN